MPVKLARLASGYGPDVSSKNWTGLACNPQPAQARPAQLQPSPHRLNLAENLTAEPRISGSLAHSEPGLHDGYVRGEGTCRNSLPLVSPQPALFCAP
ncbi:hypothetical protein SBV1_1420004 [Verrucomicrobia bacterium]|nr:hypothetical protein SBV1_1420004 [Verrucomicrobiota bacterium]